MDYQLGPGPLQVDQNTIDEKIKGDIGIVENGDVATHTIPNGYYVIWKGDLYVAKTDISSGTTLSAESNGNLTAKPNGLGGEVAALNSNFIPVSIAGITLATGVSVDTLLCYTIGNLCVLNARLTTSAEITGNTVILSKLPKPGANQKFTAQVNNGANKAVVLGTNGTLNNDWGSIPAGGFFVNVVYPLAQTAS